VAATSVLAFSVDKNSIVYKKGDPVEKHQGGLGLPILLYYILDLIRKGELFWHDEVTVNENASKESGQPGSLGLNHSEKVDLLTLFKAAVINNAPDAIIALAGFIYEKVGQSKNKTGAKLKKIGNGWGIPESAIKNITGRYYENNPQHFTTEMLLTLAKNLLSFDFTDVLFHKNFSFRGKYHESDSVFKKPPISRYFSFSTGTSINTICACEYGDETVFIVICGAKTALERDVLLLEAIHRARIPLPEPHEDFIPTNKNSITICGDTYCGERYTKWRIARDIEDPIQKYGDAGYVFSFEKVAPLIEPGSFNVVNSECVLSPVYDESQQTGKYIDFVLGAHPEKTVSCYKKVNIHAVMLANNHAMDFDTAGCRQTRKYFEEAGIHPIGTGSNIDIAERPLLLEVSGKKVILFNAYCYFLAKRYKILKHYSFGSNTGTAFGSDVVADISLWRRIEAYRKKFPDACIIFSPHWSTDFNQQHTTLRPIAKKAIDAGADIILGHGPHIPIGTELIDGKTCVYSIGNFVFNTTGIDLDASGLSPYGIVAKIDYSRKNPELRLYPVYAHNLNTFFQPYPVGGKEQFEEFSSDLMGMEYFETNKDDIGYYLSRSL